MTLYPRKLLIKRYYLRDWFAAFFPALPDPYTHSAAYVHAVKLIPERIYCIGLLLSMIHGTLQQFAEHFDGFDSVSGKGISPGQTLGLSREGLVLADVI